MTSISDELRLVRGILNAPGDTGSAEQGTFVIDLLSGSAEGMALKSDVDGWNPSIPAPKPGLWTDIPFADGRVPFASAEMNATETLRCTVTASTYTRMSEILSELYALVEDCNRFWNDEFYCQPVFLHWWAHGAPGRQYALIMSIDVDVTVPTVEDENAIVRDVVLTIEREPYWRAEVPPGANPVYWTLFADGKQPGKDYDYLADLRLSGDSGFPIQYALERDTLSNSVWYTNLTGLINQVNLWNGITIPAASIPGDAPALVQVTLTETNVSGVDPHNYTFMLARSTKTPQLATMRAGNIERFVTMLPFTAGSYAGPTLTADTGGIGGYNVTTAGNIAVSRIEFTPGASFGPAVTYVIGLNKNIQRGRFAVFIRARQHNGASGDITMRVRFSYSYPAVASGFNVLTRAVAPTVQTGTGNTTNWPLTYIDTIRLPADRDNTLSTFGAQGGSGLYNDTSDLLAISVEAARSTGVGVLYYMDLILLPYDEALVDLTQVVPSALNSLYVVDTQVLDTTGYLTRGKPVPAAVSLNLASASSEGDFYQPAIEYRGVPLTLLPNVDNTLFILEKMDATGSRTQANTIEASVNIVPRWRGVRQI